MAEGGIGIGHFEVELAFTGANPKKGAWRGPEKGPGKGDKCFCAENLALGRGETKLKSARCYNSRV